MWTLLHGHGLVYWVFYSVGLYIGHRENFWDGAVTRIIFIWKLKLFDGRFFNGSLVTGKIFGHGYRSFV